MLKKVCLTMASVAALSALVISQAQATDKLKVQDSTGSNTVFKVDDAGAGIQVNDTSGNPKAVITGQGWIGSGTNSPLSAIYAKSSASTGSQLMMVRQDANNNGGAGFLGYHNNITNASCTAAGVPSACCTGAGTGTCPASTLPQSGDRLGYFLFGGYSANGTTPLNTAGISAKTEGPWAESPSYNLPTYFAFETTASSARVEKFRISGAGNIVAGNNGGIATADLATNVTDGFLYIPNVAGALTTCSTVKQYTGHVPVWFDTTNAKICTCQGTTLKCTAALQ